MKRFISYLLVLSILGSAFHADELTKIPALIHHYSEHKKFHPSDNAITFLYKHYVLNQKSESDQDGKSDAQLPFKSTQAFHSHFSVFICQTPSTLATLAAHNFYHKTLGVSKVLERPASVWIPPQL